MADRHMKRCSTSLIIKEMQIKTTMRYHLTSARICSVKKIRDKCWGECGGKELRLTGGENVNWHSHYGKQYSGTTPLLGLYPKVFQRKQNHYLYERYVLACSQKHYSQQPWYGNNVSFSRQRKENVRHTNTRACTHTNHGILFSLKEGKRKSLSFTMIGWTWKATC